ncbi:uncharacterized protein LOC135155723 [Lytechinus pictus]|uniref:uncharacterized protein LOC135155723 n=1 Tax=Lytechinus pictus TaxID=7653 RepID=UPI0030B9BE46
MIVFTMTFIVHTIPQTLFQYVTDSDCNAFLLFSIDATDEPTGGPMLGRLVNHGVGKSSNVKLRVVEDEGTPFLCLFASKDIEAQTELLYDYGVPLQFNQDETSSYVQLETPNETLVPLFPGGRPIITDAQRRHAFRKGTTKETLLTSLQEVVFGQETLSKGKACGMRVAVNKATPDATVPLDPELLVEIIESTLGTKATMRRIMQDHQKRRFGFSYPIVKQAYKFLQFAPENQHHSSPRQLTSSSWFYSLNN